MTMVLCASARAILQNGTYLALFRRRCSVDDRYGVARVLVKESDSHRWVTEEGADRSRCSPIGFGRFSSLE